MQVHIKLAQTMAEDDDEGDKGPKTIQEIRELANQRRANLNYG